MMVVEPTPDVLVSWAEHQLGPPSTVTENLCSWRVGSASLDIDRYTARAVFRHEFLHMDGSCEPIVPSFSSYQRTYTGQAMSYVNGIGFADELALGWIDGDHAFKGGHRLVPHLKTLELHRLTLYAHDHSLFKAFETLCSLIQPLDLMKIFTQSLDVFHDALQAGADPYVGLGQQYLMALARHGREAGTPTGPTIWEHLDE